MIPAEYTKLIEVLMERTSEGKVNWEKSRRENEYQAKIGYNTIEIGRYDSITPEGYEEEVIGFEIKRFGNEKVDYFGTAYSEGNDYSVMCDLYAAARRKALKITETIDELLSDLS